MYHNVSVILFNSLCKTFCRSKIVNCCRAKEAIIQKKNDETIHNVRICSIFSSSFFFILDLGVRVYNCIYLLWEQNSQFHNRKNRLFYVRSKQYTQDRLESKTRIEYIKM